MNAKRGPERREIDARKGCAETFMQGVPSGENAVKRPFPDPSIPTVRLMVTMIALCVDVTRMMQPTSPLPASWWPRNVARERAGTSAVCYNGEESEPKKEYGFFLRNKDEGLRTLSTMRHSWVASSSCCLFEIRGSITKCCFISVNSMISSELTATM